MAKLNLSVAIGEYDRTHALIDGSVAIDGVDPVYMTLIPEEIFFRAFRAAEFDICELSLSSYAVKTAQGDCPYVAVPAFISRAFRHNAVYVRTDRVKKPADLKGRKVGVPEYQLTANVWARAFLDDDYGVKPADIHWIRGGIAQPGRPEKLIVKLPAGVRLDDAPEGATISALLEAGEIDGFIAPREPALLEKGHPHIGWLFPDPATVEKDYFKRTGFFPIMHVLGIRRTLAERYPWLPVAVLKAFEEAEAIGGREACGHRRNQRDITLRRRNAQGLAHIHGGGFLVVRCRAEPQGARLFPRPASRPGSFRTATFRRRAVSPGDLRDVQGVNKAGCSRCITARRVT